MDHADLCRTHVQVPIYLRVWLEINTSVVHIYHERICISTRECMRERMYVCMHARVLICMEASGVSPEESIRTNTNSISPQHFSVNLRYFSERAHPFARFQGVTKVDRGMSVARNAVRVSFDICVCTHAYVLARRIHYIAGRER